MRVQIPAKAKFAPLVRTSVTLAYRYERPRLHANANVDQKCSVYGPTLEKRENEKKSSGPGENCQRNVTDLAGSLVTSCRPPGRLQKGPDDRTWNAGVAVRTADGSRRTADAGDEQCPRGATGGPSQCIQGSDITAESAETTHSIAMPLSSPHRRIVLDAGYCCERRCVA